MSDTVTLYEAKAKLSAFVDAAAAGEEIVITKHGKPVAKLVPYAPPPAVRVLGAYAGQVQLAPDFDGPAVEQELAAWFEGGAESER